MDNSSRRDLLKLVGLASLGASLGRAQTSGGKSVADMPFQPKETIRIGVIGTGDRGNSLVDNFSEVPGVRITALCDTVKDKVLKTQTKLDKAGKASQPIALFHSDDHAFEGLLKRDDIDLVVIATPWNWHVPMAVAGMKQGKHVAIEVPAARTMEECWEMVNTSEATQRHCIQLENCCYGYNEMMVLNMVRAGLFGELTHGGAAYNHGLGPVAHYMDVNRGDRFDTLVSMSSISASLQSYRKEKVAASDPRQQELYKEGDFNVSLIRTVKGRVIELEHNVSSPQPYDRINLIAGTKGIFRDYPPRVYIAGARRV